MIYPELQSIDCSTDYITYFGGYNHNIYVKANQFYDMENMTSMFYPVLSPRKKRGYFKDFNNIQGIIAKDKLCYVDNNEFFYDGTSYGELSSAYTERQLVSMGAYIVIFPDNKLFNTTKVEDGLVNLGQKNTSTGTVTVTLCSLDSADYTYTVSNKEPTEKTDGMYWLDTSSTPNTLKRYSTSMSMWTSQATTYIKIASTGIGKGFSKYEGVTIKNLTKASLNTDYILYDVADDYIVVVGIIDVKITQEQQITVERRIPKMDFVVENDNRLWGCSSEKHEIYACALGNPKNWYSYMNTSQDSYAVTVGSDGVFTGAIAYLGYVLFFKEDIIHKIYGNVPSNFQIQSVRCRGVEKGAYKSLCVVNEKLYYKSKDCICIYEGSLPTSISNDLGLEDFNGGVAGAINNKYYICMENSDNIHRLYVFDTEKGLWHIEDNINIKNFVKFEHNLRFITSDNKMYCIDYNNKDEFQTQEDNFEWFVETGSIASETLDRKYISKIQIRASVEKGAKVNIYIEYDDSGEWEKKFELKPTVNKAFTVPIIPRRCDHMKLKIAGVGDCKIFSLAKITEMGSEI